MFVDRFCQKFAGEDTLSLLRCMAVANGSLSLDGTTISEIEAKRFIVSYQQPDTKPFDQWPDLTKEIHDRIEEIRTLKESARIQQTLRIDNNLLTSRVKVDSMGIYLSYKERFKEDIKTEIIETIIEKPVNYLTWYQKLLVAIGLISCIVLPVKITFSNA